MPKGLVGPGCVYMLRHGCSFYICYSSRRCMYKLAELRAYLYNEDPFASPCVSIIIYLHLLSMIVIRCSGTIVAVMIFSLLETRFV